MAAPSTTVLTQGGSSSGTSIVTASVAPVAGSTISIVAQYGSANSNIAFPASVTGLGLTWLRVVENANASNQILSIWYAICGESPGTGAITVAWNAINADRGRTWTVMQHTGTDPANPIPQSNSIVGSGGQFPTVTLGPPGSSPTSDSRAIGVFASVGGNGTPVSPWSALSDPTSGNFRHHVVSRDDSWDTTPAYHFSTGGGAANIALAFELQTLAPIQKSDADSGQFTDTDLSINYLAADAGTFSETASVVVNLAHGDTGSFTETLATIAIPVSDTDEGFLDESAFVTGLPFTAADAGSFTESTAIIVTLAGTDSATFTDTGDGGPASYPADTDSATFSEDQSAAPVTAKTGADSGQFTDASNPLFVTRTAADNARFVDFAAHTGDGVTDIRFDLDTATLTDTGTVADMSATSRTDQVGADQGQFTESTSISVTLAAADTIQGTDRDIAMEDGTHKTLQGFDSGQLTEGQTQLLVTLSGAENITVTDSTVGPAQRKTSVDPATVTDTVLSVTSAAVDSDTFAVASESADIFQVVRAVLAGDAGRFRDRVVIGLFPRGDGSSVTTLSDEDSGVFAEGDCEIVAREVYREVTGADTATATDTQSVHRGRPADEPTPVEMEGSYLKVNFDTGVVSLSSYLGDNEFPLNRPLTVEARRQLAGFFDDPAVTGELGEIREDSRFRYRYERRWPKPDVQETGWYVVSWRQANRPGPDWLS